MGSHEEVADCVRQTLETIKRTTRNERMVRMPLELTTAGILNARRVSRNLLSGYAGHTSPNPMVGLVCREEESADQEQKKQGGEKESAENSSDELSRTPGRVVHEPHAGLLDIPAQRQPLGRCDFANVPQGSDAFFGQLT